MVLVEVTIEPVHADGTCCDHQGQSRGKPSGTATGCTGRTGYQVRCSEHGVVGEPRCLRLLSQPAACKHLDSHRHQPLPSDG